MTLKSWPRTWWFFPLVFFVAAIDLASKAVADAFAASNAVYMVGDYTDVDPAITAYLQRHKAVGVPLYVVYPRGGGTPEVLPQLLTPGLVDAALARAATGASSPPANRSSP